MKRTIAATLLLCFLASAGCTSAKPRHVAAADAQYEMTTYYMGLIYRGAKWTPGSTPESEQIQAGHMANIRRLAGEGKLLLAGPFADDGDLRGIFVFKVASMEEAEALVASDPAVQAGRLRVELHPWYSAKNIVVYPTAMDVP
jgi:uncharacterized protein YciI